MNLAESNRSAIALGPRLVVRRLAALVLVCGLAGALVAGRLRSPGAAAFREPLLLEVTGCGYEWHVRYAGADGELGTADDRCTTGAPHLPRDAAIQLRLTSGDYLYTFAVAGLGVNDVAVPERTYELAFRTGAAGRLELRGDQFCGFGHPELIGTVVVEAPADFEAWLERLASPPREPARSRAGA